MNFMGKLWAVICKDFISEFRTKEMVVSMCLFSFLILVVFNFTFGAALKTDRDMTAGVLWVAFIFSGLMGMGRSFSQERERGTLSGLILCPVTPWLIFLAKLIGVFLFTAAMEIITTFIYAVLYNATVIPYLLPFTVVTFLGTLGFTSVGTVFSAISSTAKSRDVLLSVLFFPISVPVIIASVKATGLILNGKSMHLVFPWLKILFAFDLVFLLLSYLTFEYIVEE